MTHAPIAQLPTTAAEFPDGLDWINTGGRALTASELRGKVVLLDFWTYGCINCIHVIPVLRALEQKYPEQLVVVGVHCGKFTRERGTERIRDAANRLANPHPIVNDRQFRTWRSYAIAAWPTLVIIDPAGRVIRAHPGEFTAAAVGAVIDELIAVAMAEGALRPDRLFFRADPPTITPGLLRYPGKVAVDHARARLAIADSGHHRVLVGRLTDEGQRLEVERVIGTGSPGFSDGPDGALHVPQGVAFDGDTLYIADTENHAIRAADLTTGALRTVAGTGRQLRTREDRRAGALSSPWDIAVAGRSLVIAMAGTHQLHTLDLASGGQARELAGGTREDLIDGPHAAGALAQPMGIVAHRDQAFFVDAESSAVRRCDLSANGGVNTIAGKGLFDFGDRDGVAAGALLQHPQGLALADDGRLLIADSYNDALKWVEPDTGRVTTWLRGLHEPNGVAIGQRFVYVADTNAHIIMAVDPTSLEAMELSIAM